MKFEFSAGGVVLRYTQNFGSKPQYTKSIKHLEILVCQHSQHHGWVFPKGLIGDTPSTSSRQAKKETKQETAIREVEEETGIQAEIIQELLPITYWYQFEGQKIKKTVYYFLMEYLGGDITKHDHEMEQVEWIVPEEVEKRLTYPSDKKVWSEAQKMIKLSGLP